VSDENAPRDETENGSGTGEPGDESSQAVGDAAEAAAAALARARAAAKAKGLRPGLRPRRRVKDVPVGERSSAGRDPKLLGDQLDQFVTERGWVGDVAVGAVIGRWSQIVGPEIAQHCAPLDFVDGVLTVRADSTAWATQLRLLSSSLLTRLAEDVGEGTVGELRVVGPGAPTWSRGQRRVQDGRGPRDTYG
jgi:predicted nucleic acid-binding Zn ribbon protein